MDDYAVRSVRESNRIEGITWEPSYGEVVEFERFIQLERVTIQELQNYVNVCQPGAKLRDQPGMNVSIGRHTPLSGGPLIREQLNNLLLDIEELSPYEAHVRYELLHPFMDGNGRSGRMLWHWHMQKIRQRHIAEARSFLHSFYYQALDAARK